MNADDEKVVRLQDKAKARPCVHCGKPAVAAYRPFCSKHCADVDLGRWLKEDYRVPTDEHPGTFEDEG